MPWDAVSTLAIPMRLEIKEVFRIRVKKSKWAVFFPNLKHQNVGTCWNPLMARFVVAGFNGFIPSSFQVRFMSSHCRRW